MKPSHTGIACATAECLTCGWSSTARNAVGNASQHAQRTGHDVSAEQVVAMRWNVPAGSV